MNDARRYKVGAITTYAPKQTAGDYRRVETTPTQNPVSVTTGVVVPLMQALVTSALWVLLAMAGSMLVNKYTPYTLDLLLIALVVFAASSLAQWISLLAEWRALLWPETAEETYQTAVTADQPVERPVVRVELTSSDGRNKQFSDLPCSEKQLIALVHGLANGKGLSEAAWVGSKNPFSRAEFVALRSELIRRGFADWNSPGYPAHGFKLSRSGQALVRHIAKLYPLPHRL